LLLPPSLLRHAPLTRDALLFAANSVYYFRPADSMPASAPLRDATVAFTHHHLRLYAAMLFHACHWFFRLELSLTADMPARY